MTEIPVDPKIWELARHVCTQKQLTVLELREKHGFSFHSLAINLNCTRATVKEHHRAATKNVLDAIENAGGIDEALEQAAPTPDCHERNLAANIAGDRFQPRLVSEETLEEKLELDRLWRESAKPRPDSETEEKHEDDTRGSREADLRPLVRDSVDRRTTPLLDRPGEEEIA